jgi:hypothetical protein
MPLSSSLGRSPDRRRCNKSAVAPISTGDLKQRAPDDRKIGKWLYPELFMLTENPVEWYRRRVSAF